MLLSYVGNASHMNISVDGNIMVNKSHSICQLHSYWPSSITIGLELVNEFDFGAGVNTNECLIHNEISLSPKCPCKSALLPNLFNMQI